MNLRPHADAFFAWAALEFQKVRHERGLLRSALGYAIRASHTEVVLHA